MAFNHIEGINIKKTQEYQVTRGIENSSRPNAMMNVL